MNEQSIHRPLIVLTALAAIGLVAVFQSGSPNTGAGVPVAAVEPAPSVDHYERLARQHDGIRARQVTPASETQASAAADDKRRELEDSAAQREHAPQALGLEGARPDSEVELDTAQSDTELEIPGHEKARQARRLVDALESRAEGIRERIERAQADGDDEETERQRLILARLDARASTLNRHADAFEAEDGDEP